MGQGPVCGGGGGQPDEERVQSELPLQGKTFCEQSGQVFRGNDRCKGVPTAVVLLEFSEGAACVALPRGGVDSGRSQIGPTGPGCAWMRVLDGLPVRVSENGPGVVGTGQKLYFRIPAVATRGPGGHWVKGSCLHSHEVLGKPSWATQISSVALASSLRPRSALGPALHPRPP